MSGANYSSIALGDSLPDPKVLVFRGTSGIECEQFVRSVRLIALAEGKEDEDRWMLHFATARLSGKAMRWHAGLDRDIQKDWYRLVQALLDQYPNYSEDEVSVEIATSEPITVLSEAVPEAHAPSSASALPQRPILNVGLNVGRLRIIPMLGHANELYLSKALVLTTAQADALQVHLTLSDDPQRIGLIEWDNTSDRTGHVLGYNLGVRQPNSSQVEIFAAYWGHSYVQDCWRVGIDGTVGVSCTASDEATLESDKLAIRMFDQKVFFVQDFDSWSLGLAQASQGPCYEARLVFEPLSN